MYVVSTVQSFSANINNDDDNNNNNKWNKCEFHNVAKKNYYRFFS